MMSVFAIGFIVSWIGYMSRKNGNNLLFTLFVGTIVSYGLGMITGLISNY